MSPGALAAVLKDPTVPAEALAFLGEHTDSDEVQQAVVRNANTPDEAIRKMVPKLSETNLEFIVVNQTRLLRHTAIIDALEANENLNSDQLRRLRELKHDFKIGVIPGGEESSASAAAEARSRKRPGGRGRAAAQIA